MIRDAQIRISYQLLSQLRALAEVDRLGCAEAALEGILVRAFDERPELADLVKRREAARKTAYAEWLAAWQRDAGTDLPLPGAE